MNNISLVTIAKLAIRNIYLVLIVMVAVALCAFSFCQFVATPSYSATGSVLVTNGAIIAQSGTEATSSEHVSGSDITASLSLATTIVDILKTNDIYKSLSDNIDNKYTYQYLKGHTSVSKRGTDTLFIDVTMSAETEEEAVSLVNAYLSLVPDYVSDYIPNSTVAVTTSADSAYKTYPKTLSTTLLLSLLSGVITVGIIFVIFLFNNTIKDEEDFNDNYKDITLIGVIPDFASARSNYYYKSSYGKGGYSNGK